MQLTYHMPHAFLDSRLAQSYHYVLDWTALIRLLTIPAYPLGLPRGTNTLLSLFFGISFPRVPYRPRQIVRTRFQTEPSRHFNLTYCNACDGNKKWYCGR